MINKQKINDIISEKTLDYDKKFKEASNQIKIIGEKIETLDKSINKFYVELFKIQYPSGKIKTVSSINTQHDFYIPTQCMLQSPHDNIFYATTYIMFDYIWNNEIISKNLYTISGELSKEEEIYYSIINKNKNTYIAIQYDQDKKYFVINETNVIEIENNNIFEDIPWKKLNQKI
jgi:hypothetical protein